MTETRDVMVLRCTMLLGHGFTVSSVYAFRVVPVGVKDLLRAWSIQAARLAQAAGTGVLPRQEK